MLVNHAHSTLIPLFIEQPTFENEIWQLAYNSVHYIGNQN